jgi:tRNA A37 threonylcarbamoyladenosine dehydratase
MERYDSVIRTYGKDGFDKIQAAKLLVVGAGGIGCEVRQLRLQRVNRPSLMRCVLFTFLQ